jgi:hypothetical protein
MQLQIDLIHFLQDVEQADGVPHGLLSQHTVFGSLDIFADSAIDLIKQLDSGGFCLLGTGQFANSAWHGVTSSPYVIHSGSGTAMGMSCCFQMTELLRLRFEADLAVRSVRALDEGHCRKLEPESIKSTLILKQLPR